MATVPLIRNKNDVFYRYQMPKLIAKIEGSGNGIRTVISNMSLIAKSINRPAAYATKFFGYELGAQTKMDVKADIYSVNGSHDPDKLLSLLYSFIEKFVLCSSCENPETDMSVNKKIISLKCKACGATTTITERTHKLTTFIANHSEDTKKTEKKDKKSKSKSKGDDAAATTTAATKSSKSKANDDDFDNGDDFSGDELVPDPSVILAEEFKSTVNIADTCERFCQLVQEKADAGQLPDAKVQKELLSEATNLGIRDKSTLALCKALFDENIVEQIGKHQLLFVRFCVDNAKAQKYLLGGIEKIIELFPKLLASTAKILKEFYDKEIIDEEVFLEWYDKPSKKYVSKDLSKTIREKAFPFIKWLKEAEEEDDEDAGDQRASPKTTSNNNSNSTADKKTASVAAAADDDDSEDDGIGFSHKVSGVKVETVKVENKEEVDDSFIDNI